MQFLIVAVLAIVQGAAELLPISSSAHVIILEKILRLDPTSPEMTFLLVMLHTGTMIAVLVYFWSRWGKLLSRQNPARLTFLKMLVYATIATGLVGLGLQAVIEDFFLGGRSGAAIENLFGNLWIIATALAVVGSVIVIAGFVSQKASRKNPPVPRGLPDSQDATLVSVLIGAVQGLALPFRGFSRSGSTISVGLFTGLSRSYAEDFSFGLALILTVPVVGREAWRLWHLPQGATSSFTSFPVLTGLIGMVLSFLAGLAAIRWLSAWLEKGRWGYFGIYCLAMSVVIFILAGTGVLS
jgi:undecaprenyl-diphosphatase